MSKINILQNTILRMCFLLLLFLPLAVFAQQEMIQKLKVGNISISYNKVLAADTNNNGVDDRTSYYKGESLVFTAYDRDEDGKQDLWFQYDSDLFLTQSLEDMNSDGAPDKVLSYSRDEEVVRVKNLNDKNLPLYPFVISAAVIGFVVFIFRKKIEILISVFKQSPK